MTTSPIESMPPIRTATASDEEKVIAALVLAFSSGPATRCAWPDPPQYLTSFPNFVLESTNPANISLYQRHGLGALGTIRVG